MQTGPIQEAMGLGLYHEQILAIGRQDIFTTGVENRLVFSLRERVPSTTTVQEYFRQFAGKDFEVIGIRTNFDRVNGFDNVGTQGFWTERDYFLRDRGEKNPYRRFTNNCHYHASAVLQQLGF